MIFFVLLPQITYVIAQMGKDTRIMGCRCVLFLEYSSQIIWTLFTQNLGANFFILFVLKNCTFGFANYNTSNKNLGIGEDGEFYGSELLHFLYLCYRFLYDYKHKTIG